MGRPPDYEWAVLDEGQDPIPGDPHEVRDEGARLGKVAQGLRDQIRLLRDIAGDENRGKFAEKLVETANELRGGLEKVATRYEKVSGYLTNWAGDLEYAQSESIRALTKAQQAAPTANAPEAHPAPGQPQPQLTPEQQAHQIAAARAKQAAQQDLADAKRQLANAKQHRDDRGRYWMQKIEDSEHDGLKDSTWDSVKDVIHEHAGLIKLLADVCTWIVTALVIISLFIPGLDIATGLLFGLMMAAAVGHGALAATGDGSWTDVALDVFAIATLGGAAWAKSALKGSADIAEALGKTLRAGSDGAETATTAAKAGIKGADLASDANQGMRARAWSAVADWGKAVGQKFAAGGEKPVVENLERINRFTEEFPNTRLAANIVDRSGSFVNAVRVINSAANIVDQFGHWAGGSDVVNFGGNLLHGDGFDGSLLNPNVEGDTAPKLPFMSHVKDVTTWEIGS